MKKILSLGAAAAVLSLTAVAASAAITPAFSTDAPVAGETVTVEIVATGMTQEATTFTVEASENLTLTDAVKTDAGLAEFNTETKKFAWAGSSVPADGTVLLTLTYTVDAADGEIFVKLVPDAGFTDISADPITATVVGGADDVSVEESSEEVYSSEDESSEDEGGLTTTDETTTVEESTEEPADDNKGNDKGNPSTGVALAVVPAVLAGAAIVVAKKRK